MFFRSFIDEELLMIRWKIFLVGTLLTVVLPAPQPGANAAEGLQATPAAGQSLGTGFELLLYEKVRDDIGLTDAQGEKLQSLAAQFYADPANAAKTLGKILTPQQMARLKQIKLQVAGPAALSAAEVARALALTQQQRDKLKTLAAEYREKTHQAVQGTKKKNYKQVRSIMADMKAKHLEAALEVLTPQQQKKFDKMRGPKVDMDLSKL
jgi:hypothetical protein